MSRGRLVLGRVWGATALKLVLTRASEMAETTKVSASHHNTACKEVTASNSAARNGPMIVAKGVLASMRPLAFTRLSWVTMLACCNNGVTSLQLDASTNAPWTSTIFFPDGFSLGVTRISCVCLPDACASPGGEQAWRPEARVSVAVATPSRFKSLLRLTEERVVDNLLS